jgi:hypothetical protein
MSFILNRGWYDLTRIQLACTCSPFESALILLLALKATDDKVAYLTVGY